MSFESHLAQLEKKHGDLDRQIEEAMMHPSTDDLTITKMKREKLELKDKINKLQQNHTTH